MFSGLRGGPLWGTVAIVISVLAAATVLAWQHVLTGSDWLAVVSPVLTGGAAIGGAHVANQAAASLRRPASAAGVVQNDPPGQPSGAGISAMPGGS